MKKENKMYLKIWLIRDFGMENLRKTRMKRIIMSGRGARKMDTQEAEETKSLSSKP